MSVDNIPAGENPPKIMNAIIEVPEGGRAKYEIDHDTGLLRVDRILHTPMNYPANYGYFPNTLGEDGDPLDCVVVCSATLRPGIIIQVRPIGVLSMTDDSGGDEKIICVPITKVDPFHATTDYLEQLPSNVREQIKYFFEHYKDLENGKWSRVNGWGNREMADRFIIESIERFKNQEV